MTESWWANDWADYRQYKRIRALEDDLSYMSASLSAARSSTKRLQSQMSKVTGSLEQRLNRLSAAFDAFVELSDLRVILGLFDAQAMVRYRAKQLLDGNPLPGEVSDVDDYWLAPALIAARAAMDGGQDTAALEAAKSRDSLRATTFRVLSRYALSTADEISTGMLDELLPPLTAKSPRYQRAVWTLAADGYLGHAGWALATRRCAEFLDTLTGQELDTAIGRWQGVGSPPARQPVLSRNIRAPEITAAVDACARLSALRGWVADALAGHTNEPERELDPVVRGTLELLIDEGSPSELPLLARERELRNVIESNGQAPPPDTWDSPAGDTAALLREDCDNTERPGRRAVVVRGCAAHILAAADRLAATATTPLPAEVEVKTRRGTVTVTPRGADAASLERALRRAAATYRTTENRKWAAYGTLGVGVGLVALAMFAGWGWVFPAVGLLGIGAWLYWKHGEEQRTMRADAVRVQNALRADVEKLVEGFAEARTEVTRLQGGVDDDLKALRELLA